MYKYPFLFLNLFLIPPKGEAGLSGVPGREGPEVNDTICDQHLHCFSSLFTHGVSIIFICRENQVTEEIRYEI